MRTTSSTRAAVAVLASLGALWGGTTSAYAQTVTLDEGTFDISIAGTVVGSEAFTIVRRGQGEDQQTLARGEIRLDLAQGTQTLRPLVRTVGVGLEVTQYQLQTTGENPREIRLDRSGERRMHATIVTADGEREQEFRFQPGAILLEARVAHHFYFLGVRLAEGAMSVSVVRPTQRNHATAQVSLSGDESVTIAGTAVPATRYDVTLGDQSGSVWFDAEWRVLRVEYGAQGYTALRRALP